MSDGLYFLLCLGLGLFARALFLPAALIAKKCSLALVVLSDTVLAFLGGVPFAAALFLIRGGEIALFMPLAFNLGLILPSLLRAAIRAMRRRHRCQKK